MLLGCHLRDLWQPELERSTEGDDVRPGRAVVCRCDRIVSDADAPMNATHSARKIGGARKIGEREER
jgi:hypothetical protein